MTAFSQYHAMRTPMFEVLERTVLIKGGHFFLPILVYLATIYGRYHYAVDGFASFLIAAAMWRISEVCLSNE